jgi:hypothetical protein
MFDCHRLAMARPGWGRKRFLANPVGFHAGTQVMSRR